jgi:hypothetical protein
MAVLIQSSDRNHGGRVQLGSEAFAKASAEAFAEAFAEACAEACGKAPTGAALS